MTFGSVQTEPAFISNQKYRHAAMSRHKSLNDCCYSVSNLALVISAVIALIFLVKFLYDDPLYEFGEHLLSLRFYRQLVYVIVILPLVLLVPMFNAISGFFLPNKHKHKHEMDTTLSTVKLVYEALVALLVFIGLIFVAPYIRHGGVANQLDYELRRHMKRRYENEFSYEFLDSIQEEYECCDGPFYASNYPDRTPDSCYKRSNLYEILHERTCGDVLASLVSTRCIVIAACLVIILVALASLIGVDTCECLNYPSQQYNVRETQLNEQENNPEPAGRGSRKSLEDVDDCLVDAISSRLEEAESERERARPLLSSRTQVLSSNEESAGEAFSSRSIDKDPPKASHNQGLKNSTTPVNVRQATPFLTRANYIHNRPQSPIFVDSNQGSLKSQTTRSYHDSNSSLNQTEPKSVLKKSSSYLRVDSDDEDAIQEHQRQMQRDLQTRRSLLNVRFAE